MNVDDPGGFVIQSDVPITPSGRTAGVSGGTHSTPSNGKNGPTATEDCAAVAAAGDPATQEQPNIGHTVMVYGHKNKRTGVVTSWEVGRTNVKQVRKAGARVGTWDEAVSLRAKLERAEFYQAQLRKHNKGQNQQVLTHILR